MSTNAEVWAEKQFYLIEQIQTVKNLCDIALLLIARGKRETLLPTILEQMLVEAQQLVDDYCIKE